MKSTRPLLRVEAGQRLDERLHAEVAPRVGRVGAIEAIEKRRYLEQLRAVLDEVLIDQFPRAQWARGTIVAFMALLALTMGVLEIPQHADAADHNVPADVVNVERRADRSQHQDRQRTAEMFPELVEAAQDAVRVRRTVRQASRCWPSSGM